MKTDTSVSRAMAWLLRSSAGLFLLAGLLNLAGGADSKKGVASLAVKGETYYTQVSLFHNNYVHETTNYRTKTLVPINTPVTFVSIRYETSLGRQDIAVPMTYEIVVKLPSGKELRIKNIKKYSGEDLDGIFARTLGKEKVDLSSFSDTEKETILQGEVEPGMSKAAVIRAMGYPPKHQTPDLSTNQWTYWQNRMGSFIVRFRDDKVVSTR